MAGVGDDDQPSSTDGLGHALGVTQERIVLLADDHEHGHRQGRQRVQAVGLRQHLGRRGRPHGRRAGKELAPLEVLPLGPLGTKAHGRRCVQGGGVLVLQSAERLHPVLANHGEPEIHETVVDAVGRAVTGVHQHQAAQPRGLPRRRDLGDHPAQGVAEQDEPVPAQRVHEPPQVVGEQLEAVGVLGCRLGSAAVATQVGGNCVPAGVGEAVEHLPEVLLRTGEPVHQQQVALTRARFADRNRQTASLDRALLHQRPPVMALRSTT